jgi:hypothetical protein
LFAWCEVFTLGGDALEVVRIVLEAVTQSEHTLHARNELLLTSDASGWYSESELYPPKPVSWCKTWSEEQDAPSKPAVWRTYLLIICEPKVRLTRIVQTDLDRSATSESDIFV